MSQVHYPVAEAEPADEVGPHRARSSYPCWPPRLATIVAALLVGSSLLFINFFNTEFARVLSRQYGWPIRYLLIEPNGPNPSGSLAAAALVVDLFISAILLVSACATTQVGACLLVRSPRLTLRSLIVVVAATAMLLAACQLKRNYFTHLLYASFFYSVASLIVLIVSLVLRLELPRVDDSGPRE